MARSGLDEIVLEPRPSALETYRQLRQALSAEREGRRLHMEDKELSIRDRMAALTRELRVIQAAKALVTGAFDSLIAGGPGTHDVEYSDHIDELQKLLPGFRLTHYKGRVKAEIT